MLGGFSWMYARNVLLLGIILDIRLHAGCICTAELSWTAAVELYVSFLIKFFAIHQNLGSTPLGNTCWQKLTLHSYMNYPSWQLQNWLVPRSTKHSLISWRQECTRITIARSQREFIFAIQVWTILIELTDKMFQTGSQGLGNFRISARYMEPLPHIPISSSSDSMERYITSPATTVI